MLGGLNGPPIFDGEAFSFDSKTLLELRTSLMIRLGFASQLASPPPGIKLLLNSFLADAQEQMYERHSPLRNELWWPIDVQAGKRFYDIPSISTGALTNIAFFDNSPLVDTITRLTGSFIDDGFAVGMVVTVSDSTNNSRISFTLASVEALKLTLATAGTLLTEAAGTSTTLTTVGYQSLDYRNISEVWLLDDTIWTEMSDGIDTSRFNETGQAFPQNYEFRQYLEIWPNPDKTYTIYIKGHFGLHPFTEDTDSTTIDHKLVFLMALATSKLHYGQADASSYFRQLEVFLGGLVGKSHGNRRYIPKKDSDLRTLPEPQATFSRG